MSAVKDIPYVAEHLEQAAQYVAEARAGKFRATVRESLDYLNPIIESPLEAAFIIWWRAFEVTGSISEYVYCDYQKAVSLNGATYRPDFTFTASEIQPDLEDELEPEDRRRRVYVQAHWAPIAVELDGHAFHEKTLDQVTSRNQRDRDFQQAGWRVFHYSFSEFSRDPGACLSEVCTYAFAQWWRLWQEAGSRQSAVIGSEAVSVEQQA